MYVDESDVWWDLSETQTPNLYVSCQALNMKMHYIVRFIDKEFRINRFKLSNR